MINEKMKCPLSSAIKDIGGEWDIIIIRFLLEKDMRFNELLKSINGISSKTLSSALKRLSAANIVSRNVTSTQPFSVLYSLTEKGKDLKPVIDNLEAWEKKWD